MEGNKISAELRRETGKGAARRLRATGRVPAVCYGHHKETVMLSIDPLQLKKALDPDKRVNTILELDIKGIGAPKESMHVLIKDYDQDNLRGDVLHVDFLEIDSETEVEVRVPLEFTGRAEGVQMGGILQPLFKDLPVKCFPEKIPNKLVYDVTEMTMGDIARVRDIDTGEGIKIQLPPQQGVVSIISARGLEEELAAEEAEEGAEGVEVEGEEAEGGEAGAEKPAASE
jgi:large subunit ribosomal protein L25